MSRLLCVLTPFVFAYYYAYVLKHHPSYDLLWRIAMLEFMVCTSTSLLGLACTGNSASVFGDSHVLTIKKGILVSFPLRLCGYFQQNNVFKLLPDSDYGMNLVFLIIAVSGRLIGVEPSRHGILTTSIWGC